MLFSCTADEEALKCMVSNLQNDAAPILTAAALQSRAFFSPIPFPDPAYAKKSSLLPSLSRANTAGSESGVLMKRTSFVTSGGGVCDSAAAAAMANAAYNVAAAAAATSTPSSSFSSSSAPSLLSSVSSTSSLSSLTVNARKTRFQKTPTS